jgi:hypothetical protein
MQADTYKFCLMVKSQFGKIYDARGYRTFRYQELHFALKIYNNAFRPVIPSDSAEWLVAETPAAGAPVAHVVAFL